MGGVVASGMWTPFAPKGHLYSCAFAVIPGCGLALTLSLLGGGFHTSPMIYDLQVESLDFRDRRYVRSGGTIATFRKVFLASPGDFPTRRVVLYRMALLAGVFTVLTIFSLDIYTRFHT